MNPVPACRIADRRPVWVCPKCGRTLAKGIDGSSYLDPDYPCDQPASSRR